MRKNKQLLAAALAVMTLVGTSAFAESRPSNGTRGRDAMRRSGGSSGGSVNRGSVRATPRVERGSSSNRSGRIERRSEGRIEVRGDRFENRNRASNPERNRVDRSRTDSSVRRSDGDRSNDGRRGDSWRGSDRGSDRNRGSHHRYGNRQPYYAHGRISRVHPYHGGYRVWLIGAPYPFFIPSAYWYPDRYRIGLTIRLGGYYNSHGYYDYYDRYADGYRTGLRYREAEVRGVVHRVDHRRNRLTIYNRRTDGYVTVQMDSLYRDEIRVGDYIEVEGEWTRTGYFRGYDIDVLDDRDRRLDEDDIDHDLEDYYRD